ncbi:MAG: hypothetical protein JW782_00340 [Candidatus Saganbacteria bacterium]|nr:hypothetical protein [Candidatus Saganbacteria bacterium]
MDTSSIIPVGSSAAYRSPSVISGSGLSLRGATISGSTTVVASNWFTDALDDAWDTLESTGSAIAEGLGLSGGTSGCMSEGGGGVLDALDDDDGGTMHQDPPDTDADTTEGGAHINPDGTVTLPEDGTMPADIFFMIEGYGSHLQECTLAPYTTNIVMGSGLQNVDLVAWLSTDSTRIAANEWYPDAPTMPADGCFPGLINVNPANELVSCDETGYSGFAVCPSNENNRVLLYHGNVVLRNYEIYGASCPAAADGIDYIFADTDNNGIADTCFELDDTYTEEFASVAELLEDLDWGELVGTACGAEPLPYPIYIPHAWNSDGDIFLTISPSVIADARGFDENNPYFSVFNVLWDVEE